MATTVEGVELSDEEQKLLIIVWQGNAIGIPPEPECDALAQFGPELPELLKGLKRKNLLYQTRGDEEISAGCCLTTMGDQIAETLFDAGGHQFGDFLPSRRDPKPRHAIKPEVLQLLEEERAHQNSVWGTVDEHPHEVGGWLTLIRTYLARAEVAWATNSGDADSLAEVRKLGALAVACLEQHA